MGLPYEKDGDARRNFQTKPLKKAYLGRAQDFFTHKRHPHTHTKKKKIKKKKLKLKFRFLYFFQRNPKRDLDGLKYWRFAWNTLNEAKDLKFTPRN